MRRIYLDYASSTPVDPTVAKAISKALTQYSGNPSAPHKEGREALNAINESRTKIARTLSVKPEELVFTSGGTESNVLAIRGVLEALFIRGNAYEEMHIVTSTIEHSSISETLQSLSKRGVSVTYVKPNSDGIVSPESIVNAVNDKTVLVTLAHVNSESGTIEPLSDIAIALRKRKRDIHSVLTRVAPETAWPVLHADAAQSPLYLESSPHALRATLVSYDAQKVMGPKGSGILYRDYSVPIAPLFGGGSQERAVRPGTENVAGIVGAGVAFERASIKRKERSESVSKVRDYLIEIVKREVPEATLIGSKKRRVANNAQFGISGADGDYLAILMDEYGIAVTPRSACIGTGGRVSTVAQELTGDASLAKGTIRFSLGPKTSKRDVVSAVKILKRVLPLAKGERKSKV